MVDAARYGLGKPLIYRHPKTAPDAVSASR
jgi:hypothetical protein